MRKRWRLLVICGVLLLAPTVGWAQHDEPATHETPEAPAAPEESGSHAADAHGDHDKPSLLTYDPGASIWTIIVFVALVIALRAFAWKPILRVLNDREKFIQDSIDDAKRQNEDAQKLLADYRAQLEKSREEASAIVAEGRRDAEVVRRRLQDEAREEANAMMERARREIQLATDTAVKELYDRTAQLSVQVAAGIMRKELSPDDHRRLVQESLERMKDADPASLN